MTRGFLDNRFTKVYIKSSIPARNPAQTNFCMAHPEKNSQRRSPITKPTLHEEGDAELQKSAQEKRAVWEKAFRKLTDVAGVFVRRAQNVYKEDDYVLIEEIGLYESQNQRYGYRVEDEIVSVDIVFLRLTDTKGVLEQYAYPVVRTGSYDFDHSSMPLGIAVEDGVMFPLTKMAGYDAFDLRTVSLPIPGGQRFLIRDGIDLENDTYVSEKNEDSLREGEMYTLTSGWTIRFDIASYHKDFPGPIPQRDQTLLENTLCLTNTLANGQPIP